MHIYLSSFFIGVAIGAMLMLLFIVVGTLLYRDETEK